MRQWQSHITVAAVVERNGRFLVVEEEIAGRTVINQPAGHLEPGESLRDAIVRETREETGWDFVPAFVVGVYRWPHSPTDTFVRACFSGAVRQRDPEAPLDQGILRALWLTRRELLARSEHHRSPQVLRCVDDYLTGRRYPLDLFVDVV